MKVELKSIKYMEGREGLSFNANLYVDKKKIGSVRDDGNGGEVDIWIDPSKHEQEKKLREWAKSLPDITISDFGGYTFKSDLEQIVNELFEQHLKKKREAKMLRQSKKNILYGNEYSYRMVGWKGKTLKQISKLSFGMAALQKNVTRIKKELKDDQKIFYSEYLKELGVKM